KPMNCPSHYLFYQMKRRSYRELPLRLHTQDVLHRNEATGVLSGLTRVRQFQQDDAHILLMESQIADEVARLTQLIAKVYGAFGGADNIEHRPVVIHRAIYGSFERFIGILIEHYAGNFPVWLAPEQARLLPVAERHLAWCDEVAARMRAADLRVEIDRSGGRMGAMVRDAELAKIPYALAVGDKEVEAAGVSVRKHGTGKDSGLVKL